MIEVTWLDGPFAGYFTQVDEYQLYDGFMVQVGARVDGRYDSRQARVYPAKTPTGWTANWPEY